MLPKAMKAAKVLGNRQAARILLGFPPVRPLATFIPANNREPLDSPESIW
jgi:hypothetical protein